MSRQKYISNLILHKKQNLEQINRQISQQTNKQGILDQLLRQLDLSSSNEGSSLSSIHPDQEQRPQVYNKLSGLKMMKPQFQVQDSESLDSEDLSFEIEKIKMFQNLSNQNFKLPKQTQMTKERLINTEFSKNYHQYSDPKGQSLNQKYHQYSDPKGFSLNQEEAKGHCYLVKGPKYNVPKQIMGNYAEEYKKDMHERNVFKKVKQEEQTYFQKKVGPTRKTSNQRLVTFNKESLQQIEIESLKEKAQRQVIFSETAKIAFNESQSQKQKKRIQKLQQQKKLIRQQLLKQRLPQSSKLHEHYEYLDNQQGTESLNATKNNIQLMIKGINSGKYDLQQTIKRGSSKTKQLIKYIQKNVNQMNETQSKIDSYKKFILNKL